MKKILILLLLAVAVGSQAQIRKIPVEVTEAFKEKYPNADKLEWRDKLTAFVASFESEGKKYEARFTNKGVWQQTENEIEKESLPGEVKDGLDKSRFADWETTNTYEIALPGDKVNYRITVKKSDLQKKNLLFNSEGRLLKENLTL